MICDLRDISYDINEFGEIVFGEKELTWQFSGHFLGDVIGILPVIGALKYVDEAAELAKHADDVANVAKHIDLAKYTDEIATFAKYTDDLEELAKKSPDLVDKIVIRVIKLCYNNPTQEELDKIVERTIKNYKSYDCEIRWRSQPIKARRKRLLGRKNYSG